MFAQVVFNRPLNQTFTYECEDDIKSGMRVTVPLGKGDKPTTALVLKTEKDLPKTSNDFTIKKVISKLDQDPILTKEQLDLAQFLSSYYLCSIGEAAFTIAPSGKPTKKTPNPAAKKEKTNDKKNDLKRTSVLDASIKSSFELSDEQKGAIDSITKDFEKSTLHYLMGMTGSGKTAVYLEIAKKAILLGKSVIYLVPEINLTVQLLEEIEKKFPNNFAILHSKLTPKKVLTEWGRSLKGEAKLVIGARSAVFAPLSNIGVIIIDEEHDHSYKSDDTPRYNARQVAIKRGQTNQCPVVMGSATPSVESYYLMKTGVITRHNLTKRLAGGEPPMIDTIDSSLLTDDCCISRPLEKAIRATLAQKKQVILFLNRRGYSHYLSCKSCLYEFFCPNCSVPLTYHIENRKLICHYCGKTLPQPTKCPKCGSIDLEMKGFGTEYVENEVRGKFPSARVVRVDRDTLKSIKDAERVMTSFRDGEADIMLGTQMISKGLNFPLLQLVGVINADSALHSTDFRAQEKTFSLLTQVAGRAGRYSSGARVLIQTSCHEKPAIYYCVKGNLEGFYDEELEERETKNFPPYTRLLRLVFRSTDKDLTQRTAQEAKKILLILAEKIKAENKLGVEPIIEILGPAPCQLSRIKNNYRHSILLKGDLRVIRNIARRLLFGFKHSPKVYIECDVDPINML